ncbi:MAG TPA: class I SAM-dependent methyltransferase [Candidatus Cybelea sp.]|nr:class I SAM-dependent methyltransferase [Candidatus Cybelea sp.]
MASQGEAADPVAEQYEAYPYPARDPADEAKRLITGSPSHLDELTHYCFAGRLPRGRPFRALFAGGGTGDGLVMLAQQCADRGIAAEIAYLDLSAASRAIAEARIAARKLEGIRFVTGSLLDVAGLAPGPWDYIDACGVLHHLADPPAGLQALARQLAPDGGMGLMLYGALGRTGVYPLQAALRTLAGAEPSKSQVAIARKLLRDLPPTNWLKRNPYLGDHLSGGDAALFDLLLHARDRAYSVPEIAGLLDGARLAPTAFIEPIRYRPATWLKDAALIERAKALPWLEACALAELLSGNMKSHVVYAVPRGRESQAVASANNADAIPLWRDGDGKALIATLSRGGALALDLDGHSVALPIPDGAAAVAQWIDGKRKLADMPARLGLDWFAFKARFDRLYALLNPLNLLLLRG